jgi:hypothetical protein
MVWPLLAKAALPLRAGIVIVVMDTLLLVAFCLLNTEEEQASAFLWYTQKGYFFRAYPYRHLPLSAKSVI